MSQSQIGREELSRLRLILTDFRALGVAILVVIVVIIALGQAPAGASGPSNVVYLPLVSKQSTPTPVPPPTVTVNGRVKDAATGAGLPNASVTLFDTWDWNQYQVTTDATGGYSVAVPNLHRYDLSVPAYPSSPPYTYTQSNLPILPLSGPSPVEAPDILLLRNNATLSGEVTDSITGQPVAPGAATVAVSVGGFPFSVLWLVVNPTPTGSQGTYTISLAAFTYHWAEAYRTTCPQSTLQKTDYFTVSPGQTMQLNFTVPPCP